MVQKYGATNVRSFEGRPTPSLMQKKFASLSVALWIEDVQDQGNWVKSQHIKHLPLETHLLQLHSSVEKCFDL